MCVCVSLHTDYTRVGVLGKDVCGRSERRRRLCDIQIETAVFLQCVYVCETLLQSVDGRNSYRGPAACKCASVEICCLHTHLLLLKVKIPSMKIQSGNVSRPSAEKDTSRVCCCDHKKVIL